VSIDSPKYLHPGSRLTIVPSSGAVIGGTLFKIALHDRHRIDDWELVELGWYDKVFISVKTSIPAGSTGRKRKR